MINIIKPELLGNRLDADFYQKDFIGNELILSNFGSVTLSNLIDVKKSGYGVLPKSDEYLENGLPLIRGGDLSFGRVQEICVFVPEYYKDSRAIAKTGDVLILIKGACIDGPEGVARIGEAENGYLYNGSCYRLSFKQSELDGYFFIAYSQTKFFLKQKKRQIANTGISYNDESSILNYLIPNFTAIVKKYIGDKVRQAELLREWAKSLRKQIKSYFDNLFAGLNLSNPVERYSRVSLDNLVPRLNAEYYAEQYLQVEKYLKNKFGVLATIGELSPTVRSKNRPTTDCIYKEIGDLDTATGKFGQGTHYTYFDVPNNAQRVFDAGDVAVSTRRPNRGAIAVVEESSKDVFYSVFLARLKPKNKSFGYWLKEYLRHDAGKLLLLQRCTWTTYPVISEDDLETVPVPKLVDDWEYIARLSTQSVLLEEYATKLTHVAIEIVEGLIEGSITEEELIQAQNALEQGDTSLDRTILSQMTEDGYAVAGSKPLFSDLDEFYDLLEQAKALE